MPPRQKSAPRAAAGRGAEQTTRSAVNDIRHSTSELLSSFLVARRAQARTYKKELRQDSIARMKAVGTMIDGFRQAREDVSREINAELGHYMRALHDSVAEARQDVEAQLRQVAAQRRKFAVAQARYLNRTRERNSNIRAAFMHDLTDARESATRDVRNELKGLAETLHNEVGLFRQHLRQELGTEARRPDKEPAVKSSTPTARTAKRSPKPVKRAATAKAAAASVAAAPAKTTKAKRRAAK